MRSTSSALLPEVSNLNFSSSPISRSCTESSRRDDCDTDRLHFSHLREFSPCVFVSGSGGVEDQQTPRPARLQAHSHLRHRSQPSSRHLIPSHFAQGLPHFSPYHWRLPSGCCIRRRHQTARGDERQGHRKVTWRQSFAINRDHRPDAECLQGQCAMPALSRSVRSVQSRCSRGQM